jgi:hypothetical protein
VAGAQGLVEARDLAVVGARDLVVVGARDLVVEARDPQAAGARDLAAAEAPHRVAGALVAAPRVPAQAAVAVREQAVAVREPAVAVREQAVAERGRRAEEMARAPAGRDQTAARDQMAARRQVRVGPPATRVAEALVSTLLTRAAAAVAAAALGGVVIRLPGRSLESPTMKNVVASTRRKKTNSEEACWATAAHPPSADACSG